MSKTSLDLYKHFEQACALEGEARAAFLADLRARSAEHADALERLLREDERAGLVPDEPPGVPPLIAAPDSDSLDGRCEEGMAGAISSAEDILARLSERESNAARYARGEEVGHGGQGTVHRVHDEDLHRDLAMKVLRKKIDVHTGSGSAEMNTAGRFLEEAQITGQLDHPGIVPVHELGLDDEGKLFFTMKLVRGEDLRTVFGKVKTGEDGWNRARALGVLLRVCEAMAYAHAKRVIHRDLKPANVMVGHFGEVYVMDWGVARVLGEEGASESQAPDGTEEAEDGRGGEVVSDMRSGESGGVLKTLDGHVVGTPAYMSPEQALGHQRRVGPHSDVYSAGAMLYELLAGNMPYAEPARSMHNYVVWYQVQKGPPRPLSKVAPEAPDELVAICECAMAREPEGRYRDMSELAADLSAYLEHRVVSAYDAGAMAQLRKWIERNKPLATAMAGIFVVLVIGFFTTLMMKLESDRNAQLAEERGDDLAQANDDLEEKRQEAVSSYELAEERRVLAERKTQEVLRLSALQDIEALLAEADRLWPVRSRDAQLYRDWIEQARALTVDLPSHIATRDALRGRTELQGEERWWLQRLDELITELEHLEGGHLSDRQSLPSGIGGGGWTMTFRLQHAERLEQLHAEGGAFAKHWKECLPGIRAAYPGLEIDVQEGLLPMGADPDSGLWEFADIQTGHAELRDEEGFLRPSERGAIVFVLLPGGMYLYGAQPGNRGGPNWDRFADPDFEGPPTEVEVAPFFLSKYELTQAQWMRFTGRNPSEFQPPSKLAPSLTHPVEMVSWDECTRQLARLGFALPSEIQWEYAARAGTDTVWWTGNDPRLVLEVQAGNIADQSARRHGMRWPAANKMKWFDDGYVVHAPVGSFTPNPFGMHDMLGNVWEWCEDRFDSTTEGRVMRGGSYRMEIQRARSAHRSYASGRLPASYLGVRPARNIEPALPQGR